MPVLRTKAEPGAALRALVICAIIGGSWAGAVAMVFDACTSRREPAWMWLVRACERDKGRCLEAEAHLVRQCRAGDRAACAYQLPVRP